MDLAKIDKIVKKQRNMPGLLDILRKFFSGRAEEVVNSVVDMALFPDAKKKLPSNAMPTDTERLISTQTGKYLNQQSRLNLKIRNGLFLKQQTA